MMEDIYFDVNHPASFGGVDRLRKAAASSTSATKTWLQRQRAYTLHKPARRRYETRQTLTSHAASQFQSDLIDISSHHAQNKGNKYILTVVDVFSRYGWALPLKRKTGGEMAAAFKKIFRVAKCHYLQSDDGTEYFNKTFQRFLKQRNVKHFSVKSPFKASMVERFNRTLKERLFRYFTHKGSYKWLDALQPLVKSYNNASHRSLPSGMTPQQAFQPQNHFSVWESQEKRKRRRQQPAAAAAAFKKGDTVRISKWKATFDKGYIPGWSEELFKISKVDESIQPVTYVLQDLRGEKIEGIFYTAELQHVRPPIGDDEDSWLYAVEKVIRRQGKRFLVKFIGYPDLYWVDELQNYKQRTLQARQ